MKSLMIGLSLTLVACSTNHQRIDKSNIAEIKSIIADEEKATKVEKLLIKPHANPNIKCEEGACRNTATAPMGIRMSTTPTYTNLYPIELLKIGQDCSPTTEGSSPNSITLNAGSYFRETFIEEEQTKSQRIVHVYETPDNGAHLNSVFNSPFILCLEGENAVNKSYYKSYGGIDSGFLFVPFKIRNGDIYSDAMVGPYISYHWNKIELLATATLAQIATSNENSADINNELGISGAFGIVFEVSKGWDVAFVIGVDHLSGSDGNNWEFQDKPWWTLAVGFNFTRDQK